VLVLLAISLHPAWQRPTCTNFHARAGDFVSYVTVTD